MVTMTQGSPTMKVVLNFASLEQNSNKFYIMEVEQSSRGYTLHTNYGRMGQDGRHSSKDFPNLHLAESHLLKMKASKEAKGYKEVKMEESERSAQTVSGELTPERKIELESISDKALRLIGRLYSYATTYTQKSVKTPLGSISSLQLREGLHVLGKIEDAIRNNEIITPSMSDEFYSIIPVIFGTKVNVSKMNLDDMVKVNNRRHLLHVMESIVEAKDSLEKSVEEKYKALDVKLEVLSQSEKEFKDLKKWIEKSQSPHHHFHIDVLEIYSMEDEKANKRFNPYKVETKLLFHGSRNENILSIMQSGLRIRPSGVTYTGSMFGDSGIYFAEESSKSGNYCWGFDRRNEKDSHYLLICEVATGKIKEYDSAQPHLKSAPRGYNSVLGKKGSQLIHNEYIVYRETQSRIKYIVEFRKK